MNKQIWFYQQQFTLQTQVFRPRYETEQLIDLTVQHMQNWFKTSGRILEIGVGSGVIALSLKQRFPNWSVDAVDIDQRALANTKLNATRLALSINCWQSDLLKTVTGKYAVIIANLPYVATNAKLTHDVLQHDPHHALFGGVTGLKYLKALLTNISDYLENHYLIALEIDPQQLTSLIDLIQQCLPQANWTSYCDYNQLKRFLFIYHHAKAHDYPDC